MQAALYDSETCSSPQSILHDSRGHVCTNPGLLNVTAFPTTHSERDSFEKIKLKTLLIINDMQILLCLLLLTCRRGRQVVVATAPIILQVLIRQVSELCRFHVQVLERLRATINDLVQTLLLHLVGTQDRPPYHLVQVVQHGLEQPFRQVDVSALLYDFSIHNLGDFSHAVVRGTVEFKGLSGGGIVVADPLESFADVNGLDIIC